MSVLEYLFDGKKTEKLVQSKPHLENSVMILTLKSRKQALHLEKKFCLVEFQAMLKDQMLDR
ncbi:MAG: hypothetical protein WBA93_08365 [Microcoleaceae cyanobacterium]